MTRVEEDDQAVMNEESGEFRTVKKRRRTVLRRAEKATRAFKNE